MTPPQSEPAPSRVSPKRRGTVLAFAALSAVVVLLGGALAFVLLRDEQPVPASAAAAVTRTATSTPPSTPALAETTAAPVTPASSQPPLNERAACRVLVPLVETVVDGAVALVNQNQQPDVKRMQDAERQLRQLRERAPDDMRSDIDAVVLAASTLQDGVLDGTALSAPGKRLLQRCRKYPA